MPTTAQNFNLTEPQQVLSWAQQCAQATQEHDMAKACVLAHAMRLKKAWSMHRHRLRDLVAVAPYAGQAQQRELNRALNALYCAMDRAYEEAAR